MPVTDLWPDFQAPETVNSPAYLLKEQAAQLQKKTKGLVLADEVLHAPLADPVADLMTFWIVCPTIGNAVVTTSFIQESSVATDPNYPNLCTRPASGNGLRPLTKSDWVALGLPLNRRTTNRSTP